MFLLNMSVFPKKITLNENTVIHVKMSNLSQICLPVKVNLYVENKESSYKENILKNESFILPPVLKGSSENFIEKYFIFRADCEKPLGRYDCVLSIEYLNKKDYSLTRDNAFFYIEKISSQRKKKFIFLKNESNAETTVKIFYIGKSFSKALSPFEIFKTPQEEFLYFIYANNTVIIP